MILQPQIHRQINIRTQPVQHNAKLKLVRQHGFLAPLPPHPITQAPNHCISRARVVPHPPPIAIATEPVWPQHLAVN